MRVGAAVLALALAVLAGVGSASAQSTAADTVRGAVVSTCQDPDAAPLAGASRLPDPFRMPGPRAPRVSEWALDDGTRLRLSTLENGPRSLHFADLYDGARGVMRAVAGGDCNIIGGRAIDYGEAGGRTVPMAVRHLDASLTRTVWDMQLNPPAPSGEPRACLRVGLLDNGVNYLRPDIADRLAYDETGALIGLDTWEDDGRPFDYGAPPDHPDPRRSIFNPRRHGSAVASVLIDHSPESVCIVPVRYPPFAQGQEVADAIAFMAENGVRIVSVQSGRLQPWPEFRAAIAAHPEILFVIAAGNEGADLSRNPRYPASYGLPNTLVVAGTDASGTRLWPRSNRGGAADMIGYWAEDLDVRMFDGEVQRLSGTSFSAPAVAGIAAGMLSEAPDLDPEALKARLFALAGAQGTRVGDMPVLPETP